MSEKPVYQENDLELAYLVEAWLLPEKNNRPPQYRKMWSDQRIRISVFIEYHWEWWSMLATDPISEDEKRRAWGRLDVEQEALVESLTRLTSFTYPPEKIISLLSTDKTNLFNTNFRHMVLTLIDVLQRDWDEKFRSVKQWHDIVRGSLSESARLNKEVLKVLLYLLMLEKI